MAKKINVKLIMELRDAGLCGDQTHVKKLCR